MIKTCLASFGLLGAMTAPGFAIDPAPAPKTLGTNAQRALAIALKPLGKDSPALEFSRLRKEFKVLCTDLGARETRLIIDRISESPASEESYPFGLSNLDPLYRRLGETEGEKALSHEPKKPFFHCGLSDPVWALMISGIARKDGPKAFELWKTFEVRSREDSLVPTTSRSVRLLMEGWSSGNTAEAREALKCKEIVADLEPALLGYYAGLPAHIDWVKEAALIPSLPFTKEVTANTAFIALTERWLRKDPAAALQAYRKNPAFEVTGRSGAVLVNALPQILGDWITEDPDTALPWLQKWKPKPGPNSHLLAEPLVVEAISRHFGNVPVDPAIGASVLTDIWPLLTSAGIRREVLANYASGRFLSDPFSPKYEEDATRLKTILALPGLTDAERTQFRESLDQLKK